MNLDLDKRDLQLLVKSLDHCVATCENKTAQKPVCDDCEAAKNLSTRLQRALKEVRA